MYCQRRVQYTSLTWQGDLWTCNQKTKEEDRCSTHLHTMSSTTLSLSSSASQS